MVTTVLVKFAKFDDTSNKLDPKALLPITVKLLVIDKLFAETFPVLSIFPAVDTLPKVALPTT